MKICNLKFKIVNSKKRGFSIIELVFAMSFLTIIIFGVISLQSGNLAMINSQTNQTQAHFYANQGIQILKSLGYNPAYAGCTPETCIKKLNFLAQTNEYELIPQGGTTNEPVSGTIFERYITLDTKDLTNAYKAIVYIEWEDSTGKHSVAEDNSHVEAKTIISD